MIVSFTFYFKFVFLKMSPCIVPKEVFKRHDENDDVTVVGYGGDDLVITATSQGVMCLWSTVEKRCFMHWQADTLEISNCPKLFKIYVIKKNQSIISLILFLNYKYHSLTVTIFLFMLFSNLSLCCSKL